MKILLLLTIFFAIIPVINIKAESIDHSLFDSLLQRYVVDGRVNYSGLEKNRAALTDYLHQLQNVNADDFETWSKEDQMAFWINAYNAITIEGILRNYPIKWGGLVARARFPKSSIRQIKGFWDTVFITVMGKDITLNDIEHKILRKEFKDPRIHFVLVCASLGCPTLENRAFFAADLDKRLNQATAAFIKNPEKVRLDRSENTLYLSAIFDWYAVDFPSTQEDEKFKSYSTKERGVVRFVAEHLAEAEKQFVIDKQPKIKYLHYDWSLNEQR